MDKSKCCTCGFEWKTGTDGSHSCAKVLQERIDEAIALAVKYGGIDGAHHKDWVIDQVIRVLAKDKYNEVVKNACNGSDGQHTYSWDCGIAP